MIERFTFNNTTGGALKIFDASTGLVLDFNDETFKAHASATTPFVAMSAAAADSLGTGRQLNYLGFDLARLNRGPTPKRFFVGKYSTVSPGAGDNPVEEGEIVVQFGQRDAAEVRLPVRMSCRTLDGYAIQLAARAMRQGRPVNLMECGRAMFTVNTGTDVVTSAGHGLSDGDFVCFHTITGTLPGGISAGTAYEVSDVTTDTFKLVGIDISGTGTAPYFWDRPTCTITVREHGSAIDTFTTTLTAADIANNRFEGETPEGDAFTVTHSTDTINSVGHSLSNGAQVALCKSAGGTLPDGLSETVTYYVVNAGTDDFQVALTPGGDPVEIDDAGTGNFWWVPATPQLTPDRQYEVGVAMVLAGETVTDTWEELTIG